MLFKAILPFLFFEGALSLAARQNPTVCEVQPGGSSDVDDAPAILDAFETCGQGGRIVFQNTTYHINSVMDITGLSDCEIDLQGTLLWGTDIEYWLDNSIPVGYQNQSSAWFLGGDNILFDGHGYGTLDGNGQAWYDYVNGESNYPGRPHAITISETRNSQFQGLRFVQSQMWSVSIINTQDTVFDSIYVRSHSDSGSPSHNTDGADTYFSSGITFSNWIVENGDDSISAKANSTDITITDCTFIGGLGIALGSIGQYNDEYEVIEGITVNNIEYIDTLHAVYFKTWTGEDVGDPPNGGGGGLGYAADMSFTNLSLDGVRGSPIAISQCTTFSGEAGDCNSSEFNIRDISVSSLTGTIEGDSVASLQCSSASPCSGIEITDVSLTSDDGNAVKGYLCSNVEAQEGFECTGAACEDGSSAGEC